MWVSFDVVLHRPEFTVTLLKLDENLQYQDNSDSDGESTGEAGPAGRRFFNRKRRTTDTSLSFVERGGQSATEGRLRRMSNVIARRPRTSSLHSGTAEGEAVEDKGDGGPATAWLATQGSRKLSSGGDEIEVATRGAAVAAAGAAGSTSNDDSAKEKELLPPFTMALAVMLTGLRVFVVDQVCGATFV